MNFADIILVIILLAAVVIALRRIRRTKGTCCGDCSVCMQKHNKNCP